MSSLTAEKWSAADDAALPDLLGRSAKSPWDWRRSVKRVADVTVTLLILIIALPLMAVIALTIKVSESRPVLFCQARVGLHGALVTIFKFRTMDVDAEANLATLAAQNESHGNLFKIKRDPRINPIGRILRRLSLDELPQPFNVLNGTMSLVGPRPHLPAEIAELSPDDAQRRSDALPGMTGLWQISGRSNLDTATSIALDLQYVDTWPPRLDVRILFGTIAAVVSARGAH